MIVKKEKLLRPDWTKRHFKSDNRLDLSFNVCIDRYINYKFNPNQFAEASKCYDILANYHNVSPYNIAIGFGISDLINRVIQFCALNNLGLDIFGNSWKAVKGYKDAYRVESGKDVAYVASHNGNDGSILMLDQVDTLCDEYQWVMLDEAYSDFYPIKYNDRNNLIRFKTMTKSLPLPGIRFGWCYGNDYFIKQIQDLRHAHHCIGDVENQLPNMLGEIPFHVERMLESKSIIESEYDCRETHGNYVLINNYSDIDKTIATRKGRMALCDKETWYENKPHSENRN